MSSKKQRKSAGKSRGILILLFVVLITIVIVFGCCYYFFVYQPSQKKDVPIGGEREANALQGSLKVMSAEEIQEELNRITEEGMFNIKINTLIAGYSGQRMLFGIENDNSNRYLMQVTIYINEKDPLTNEVIGQKEVYRTNMIDPGYYIEYDMLDVDLVPGTYDGIAVFNAYYPDTGKLVGNVSADVELWVLEPDATPIPDIETELTATVTPNAK